MEGLPLLPGYCFNETGWKDYSLKQKLKFRNGFPMVSVDFVEHHTCGSSDCQCNARLVEYDPTLTYGRPRTCDSKLFLPHYVLYDQKTLRLDAYFKQGIFGSADEHYRVRHVRILYYLEDDTMAVLENKVRDSGLPQGKLVRRQSIPRKDKPGTCYSWKDLNIGVDMEIYGVIYRVVDCDKFTREFLRSRGIDVNDPEPSPPDPYLEARALKDRLSKPMPKMGAKPHDKRLLHLEYAGLALTFEALWENEPYLIYYFLDDNTVTIGEGRKPGQPRAKPLLKRAKVPKDWRPLPAAYLERTDDDVSEYYAPVDFKIGGTVFIFGRRLLLTDCDGFTRKYYADVLHAPQPERLSVPKPGDECEQPCQGENKRVKRARDMLRKLYNFPRRLRYTMLMEAVRPEDEGREFVLEYNLADGTVRISEIPKRNSGRMAGRFLTWMRVPKRPGDDKAGYYTPEDFEIGGRLCILGHWFRITGTEPFVYNYMRANPDKFDERLKRNVEDYLKSKGLLPGSQPKKPACDNSPKYKDLKPEKVEWPCDKPGAVCDCPDEQTEEKPEVEVKPVSWPCDKQEVDCTCSDEEDERGDRVGGVSWPCDKQGVKCTCSDDEGDAPVKGISWPCDKEGVKCSCSDEEGAGEGRWPCDNKGVKCDCPDED